MQNSIFQLDSTAPSFYGTQIQQNQVIHSNIPNGSGTHCLVDSLDSSLCHNLGMHLPSLNGFNENGSQVTIFLSIFFYKLIIWFFKLIKLYNNFEINFFYFNVNIFNMDGHHKYLKHLR